MKVLSDILHKAGILKEAAEAYSSGGYAVLVRNSTTQRLETISSTSVGSVGGTGVAGRVAFWSDTNNLSSSSNLFWDNSFTRLGIGTSTPAATLDVVGSGGIRLISATNADFTLQSGGSTDSLTLFARGGAYGSTYAVLGLNDSNAAARNTLHQGAGLYLDTRLGIPALTLAVAAIGGGPVRVLNISSTGNVSIGTQVDAGFRLDVDGQIRASSRVLSGLGGMINNCLYTYISNHCGSVGYLGFGFNNTLTPSPSDTVFEIYQGSALTPAVPLFNFKHTIADNTGSSIDMSIVRIGATINQTNTSNGAVRGIFYNPTVTSIIGNHFAFESTAGKIKVSDLSGTGSRMVVADSSGVLTTQAVPTSTNIYNSDGTLTGNRTVTMGSYTLSFTKDLLVNGITVGRGNNQDVSNTALGYNALINNTSANFVTAVGSSSQTQNISGGRNTSIGTMSLNTATTSGENVAVGDEAGRYVTGSQNTILGSQAWKGSAGNSTGIRNIAIGWGALPNTTSGSNNIAMGPAMGSNSTGSLNVAIGGESLTANTTSSGSVAVGYAALTASTGSSNIGIGNVAGKSVTSGIQNIIIGTGGNGLPGITTGNYNTIIGSQISGLSTSLSNNIVLADGQGNIRIRAFDTGNVTINGNTDAGYKLDVFGSARVSGDMRINSITVGRGANNDVSNTAFGFGSLGMSSASALNNTAMGVYCLQSNTSGLQNTAIGSAAGAGNVSGVSNVYIGFNAGVLATSSSNTLVGTSAGSQLTTGGGNIFIGYLSGFDVTTGSNNTIIGRYIYASTVSAALSNNIILGDGSGNMRLVIDNNGNAVLGGSTTYPTFAGYKLDVQGTGRFTNTLSVITTGTTNDVALFKSTEPYITIEAAGGSNSASIFLKPSTSAQNATIQNRTGGGLEFYVNADYTNAKMTIKGTTVNIRSLPTSATGLSSGDIWNDAGTLKVA